MVRNVQNPSTSHCCYEEKTSTLHCYQKLTIVGVYSTESVINLKSNALTLHACSFPIAITIHIITATLK